MNVFPAIPRRRVMVAVVAAGVLAVPVMTGSAYATGTSSAKPGSRPHSPEPRSNKSRAEKRIEYGTQVAAYLKTGGGAVPGDFRFTAVSGEDELLHSFNTHRNMVFTVLATRVKDGKTEAAEFLIPVLGNDGQLRYVTNSGGRPLTGKELHAAGLTNLFYRVFGDGINSYPAGPVTNAIKNIIQNSSSETKQKILERFYLDQDKVFTPGKLADKLAGFDGNAAEDRSTISRYLGYLETVGLIKKTKEADKKMMIPSEYQALSPEEMATRNAQSLQARVNEIANGQGITVEVLRHLYRNIRTFSGKFDVNKVHTDLGEDGPALATVSTAILNLAEAGLITKISGRGPGKTAKYSLVEGVALS